MVENGFNKRGACYVTDCNNPNCNHVRSNESVLGTSPNIPVTEIADRLYDLLEKYIDLPMEVCNEIRKCERQLRNR